MRAALREYQKSFSLSMIAYVFVLTASILVLVQWGGQLPLVIRIALALAPMLPIAYLCKAMVRFVRDCDEFERRIELESIAQASLIVGLVYLCLGFLTMAKVLSLHGGLAALMVFPALCGIYGACKCLVMRKYQ